MTKIVNHKYTIEEAFDNRFYIVPDYQREYVWAEKEVNQLLKDIEEQIDAFSPEYFIGTVIVSPTSESSSHFEVIDGQQRLTTLFLILCALRSLFKEEPQAERIYRLIRTSHTNSAGDIQTNLKLEPRYENAGKIIQKLVDINSTPQAVRVGIQNAGISIYGSVKKLLDAYSIIHEYLSNYDIAELKKYWGHLSNNVVFIQIETDVSYALKIFETINERGIGLNPMDLIKNLLFIEVKREEFEQLKEKWKKITKPLEKVKAKPLRFLRYFLMANYDIDIKNKRNPSVISENEIYKWFSENAEKTGYRDDPFGFVEQVARNADKYIGFSDSKKHFGNDGEPSIVIESLKKLTGNGVTAHYILLLATINLPKPLFDHFVTQLENYLFYFIFTNTPGNYYERNFSIWADKLRAVAGEDNTEKQCVSLNEFITDNFQTEMNKRYEELKFALSNLTYDQKPRVRYLLARIAQYVDMEFRGQKSRDSLNIYYNLEIEHILPEEPNEELKLAWANKYPELGYEDYKKKLGNLTLLEKPHNIVAGNDFYSEKKTIYPKSSTYLTRSLVKFEEVGTDTSVNRINEKLFLCEGGNWGPNEIEQRQEMLIDLAFEVWKITPYKS